MFGLILFNGLAPEHSRGTNVSAHIQVAAGICIRLVLRRHDRDPNVSTHIRIAAVLWDGCGCGSMKSITEGVPRGGRWVNEIIYGGGAPRDGGGVSSQQFNIGQFHVRFLDESTSKRCRVSRHPFFEAQFEQVVRVPKLIQG